MLDRVEDKFDLRPERLIADTAYGTGPLLGWLVDRKIAPHIPVFPRSAGDAKHPREGISPSARTAPSHGMTSFGMQSAICTSARLATP